MTDIISSSGHMRGVIPADDIGRISEIVCGELYEAAACFWTFRCLHRISGPEAILLGDYAFGRFSYHLAKIDSVPLTDAFADYLSKDADIMLSLDDYLAFLKEASAEL